MNKINSVKTRTSLMVIFGLLLGVGASSSVLAETITANSVPNLTTTTVKVVPPGQVFRLRSAVIAKNSGASACCQRIYKNNLPVTGFMTASGSSTFQIEFSPPIVYNAGQQVRVRNGASGGAVSFTLIGN